MFTFWKPTLNTSYSRQATTAMRGLEIIKIVFGSFTAKRNKVG